MMQKIYANKTVSVTELKRNLASILDRAGNDPVAVLNHNKPEAYLLSAASYERLLERLEDLEDARLVQERADGPFVEVSIDDL
ncbi:type II toxin-antitoxin system Phd/YefM family antitoxin [Maridesulfovibrio sp.]|uniref:type II toxin-antitoxin system Phd/YefM family antitoxin n=1 Tax=Maridesulfovibrio sp. TaxID=2795000 RepID=UPI002AA7C1E7|nr:type II toxin-antitoxin system Phd/YefM family antitoxin [Maridesulfovibrio sp.]